MECFDGVVDFYKVILPNALQAEEVRENVAIAQHVSSKSVNYFQAFFNIVVGRSAHPI